MTVKILKQISAGSGHDVLVYEVIVYRIDVMAFVSHVEKKMQSELNNCDFL